MTKNLLKRSLSVIFMFCLTGHLAAQTLEDRLTLDQPIFSGTGCPQSTTTAVLTPDQGALSIIFDQFQVSIPNTSGDNDNHLISELNPSRLDRFTPVREHKVCDILINSRIPRRHYLEAVEVSFDFRGFSFVEPGAQVEFRSLFYPQSEGNGYVRGGSVLEQKTWRGTRTGVDTDWLLQSKKVIPLQQNCNGPTSRGHEPQTLQLHLKNILMADIPRGNYARPPLPKANITLDSADITSQMKIVYRLRRCEGHPVVAPHPLPGPTRPQDPIYNPRPIYDPRPGLPPRGPRRY